MKESLLPLVKSRKCVRACGCVSLYAKTHELKERFNIESAHRKFIKDPPLRNSF